MLGHLISYEHLWAQVDRKRTGNEPEVYRKWNARDLHAQGACTLRFLVSNLTLFADI